MTEPEQKENTVTVRGVRDFNTDHIFDCGQCFRWNREPDGSYTGTVYNRTVNISFSGDTLTIDNCSIRDFDEVWRSYLDLDRDYGKIKAELAAKDSRIKPALEYGNGIRLLRQDPWETVISFIISQNSNIPRIKKCIETLCGLFGEPLGMYRGRERYSFPSAERLAALEPADLEPVRLGYRDKYVLSTARMVASDGGAALKAAMAAPAEEAEAYIRSLKGVGPKVAGCILLFALQKYDSFPLDVWMKKIMHAVYGFDENDTKGMTAFAREHFGPLSGFAQQYLFYYARYHL